MNVAAQCRAMGEPYFIPKHLSFEFPRLMDISDGG